MIRPKLVLLLTALIALAGCATPYQQLTRFGGVADFPLSANTASIEARGNRFTTRAQVEDLSLIRAAETTQRAGYSRFIITSLTRDENVTHHVEGGEAVPLTAGTSTITVYSPPRLTERRMPVINLVIRMLAPSDAGFERGLVAADVLASAGARVARRPSL